MYKIARNKQEHPNFDPCSFHVLGIRPARTVTAPWPRGFGVETACAGAASALCSDPSVGHAVTRAPLEDLGRDRTEMVISSRQNSEISIIIHEIRRKLSIIWT